MIHEHLNSRRCECDPRKPHKSKRAGHDTPIESRTFKFGGPILPSWTAIHGRPYSGAIKLYESPPVKYLIPLTHATNQGKDRYWSHAVCALFILRNS